MRFSSGKCSAFLLLLLLATIGCVNPEEEEQLRFDCVELSSGSFAMVPDCGSQEQCYQKVLVELFSFDDSALDFESRRVLEEYKNSLANSWRYFNEGQIELKKIRELCWNKTNYAELPEYVNRLNHSLIQAFAAADSANRQAAIFLLNEKEWLGEQKLDRVREEPLFDDWILLQNNWNELQSKNSEENSLAGRMLRTQERIDAVFSQYGFGKRFVSTEQLADLLPQNRKGILENLPKNQPLLPAFGGIIVDFAAGFSNQQRLQESIAALKRFPAFPFFSAYRELVGTEDSVAEEMSRLAGRIAIHHRETEQKTAELQEELDSKIRASGDKIRGFQIGPENGLTAETFQALVVALKPETRISLKGFEITDWSQNQPKMEQKLLEIRTDFEKTSRKRALSQDSVGETLLSFKQTQNRLEEWENNLFFLENEWKSGLLELCSERLKQIEQQTKQDFSEQTAEELASQARFFLGEFKKGEESKKLHYCNRAIGASERLSLFLQDQKEFESQTEEETGNCFSFLEIAFENQPNELKPLEWLWEQLQENRKNPSETTEELRSDCQNLEQKATSRLSTSETIVALSENVAQIRRHWSGIQQLQTTGSSTGKNATMQKKVLEWQSFFFEKQPRLEKILPVLETLSAEAKKQQRESRELFEEQLKGFLQETAQVQSFSETVPKANQENELVTQLIFSNPSGIEWQEPLEIELKTACNPVILAEKSQGISRVECAEQKLLVFFSAVPIGISQAKIKTGQTVSTEEKNDFLLANQFKAAMQKTIRFETESEFPELSVSTALPAPNAANIWVVFRNRETAFSHSGNQVEFRLEKVSKQSTVSVFFTVPDPFQASESFSGNGNELEWKIEVENSLAERIPKPQIVLFLPENSVEQLVARDESGEKLSVIQLEKECRIEFAELLSHEQKTITVTAKTGNQRELLEKLGEETETSLEELATHSDAGIREKAKQLLAELLGEQEKKQLSLETVFRLAKQARELQEKANRYRLDAQQFLETQAKTEQKIAELEKLVQELEQQGFGEIGKELEGRIQQGKDLLLQAKNSNALGEKQLAGSLSLRALAALEEGKNKNRTAFEQKRKEFEQKAQQIRKSIAELLYGNSVALGQQQKMDRALLLLEQSAWETNPQEFLNQMKETGLVMEETGQTVNNLVKEKAGKTMQEIQQFRQLVSPGGLGSKNQKMLDGLAMHPESELTQLGIGLPFRKMELEKRKQTIAALVSQKQETALTGFEELFKKGEFAMALQGFAKSEKDWTESRKQAKQLEVEIGADWQALGEKAGILLEKIQKLGEQGKLSSKEAAELLKAQKLFGQEEFLEALVTAKKMDGNKPADPTGFAGWLGKIPSAIIPIIAGIVALAAWRMRKPKNSEPTQAKIRIERIPNEL